ncbi:hypothetical protein L1049_028474 [Liquidambar formosana]|uniref:Uncharacterized protein n=1 Tax=Liquidambar formosana TaxID=63359 RepID=A0AAP0RKM1_LIQFO
MGLEDEKSEAFRLISIVENHFPSFPYSELADIEGSSLEVEISSVKELSANGKHPWKAFLNDQTGGRKRPRSANYDGNIVEKSPIHKGKSEKLDLNCQCHNETNPGRE